MLIGKDDIKAAIELLVSQGFKRELICVGGGGALVMMGHRRETADLNIWVDEPLFSAIAEKQGVTNHPMTDTAVPLNLHYIVMETHGQPIFVGGRSGSGEHLAVWVRQHNRYFGSVEVEGVQIFDPLSLLIQKRGGYIEPRRPADKRKQDHADIVFLNNLMAEKNKVSEPA